MLLVVLHGLATIDAATPHGGDQVVMPTPQRLLPPIPSGWGGLWYQMALVDTTVEQSLVSPAAGTETRGRECVYGMWRATVVGMVGGEEWGMVGE